jgi:class 3 adenylate cyclase
MASMQDTAQRDQDRALAADLVAPHAPPDWERRFRRDDLLDAVIAGEPIQMFVMAADIRESTLLMKESVRFERFAHVMDRFVSSVRRGIRTTGGWFDKFTGDGFLAYWLLQSSSPEGFDERWVQTAGDVAHTAHSLIELFHTKVLEDFRANSHNLSAGVGLSMGLDAGPGYLVKIADELTVVGSPVVGAVRMVTAAALPQEIIANVYLGERLHDGQEGVYEALGVTVSREVRPTKEYPRGQEVYALTFDGARSAEVAEEGVAEDGDDGSSNGSGAPSAQREA